MCWLMALKIRKVEISFGKKVARPRTLVFQVPESLRNGSKQEFVQKIITAVKGHEVSAVQLVPGYHIPVTFKLESSSNTVFHDGLVLDDVNVHLIEADSTMSTSTIFPSKVQRTCSVSN